jgi:phosphatidate phosphatase LPIN
VHLFELSLCGTDEFAPDCKADEAELDAFDKERLTYGRFMEDPNIVDDPRLVVYYDGLHMTWTTGYPLLFALAMFRRTQPSKPDTTPKGQQPRPSGYGWSRWWRGGAPSGVGIVPPPIEKTASAHEVVTKEKLEAAAPVPISASSPVSEAPSPTDSPALSPEQAIADEKHYAKTLRLSSDQLKQLNLKPGPNTVQFSVTSSYSGQAVVSARIFLWDELDQVIISDIDGTITKSDALGHVFAAIGRDWTHVGIANLYTDICNNGYKILYLTARAIGQADTTRDYLKTIVQGEYRMPEGPVIMSPDRLMASLHR